MRARAGREDWEVWRELSPLWGLSQLPSWAVGRAREQAGSLRVLVSTSAATAVLPLAPLYPPSLTSCCPGGLCDWHRGSQKSWAVTLPGQRCGSLGHPPLPGVQIPAASARSRALIGYWNFVKKKYKACCLSWFLKSFTFYNGDPTIWRNVTLKKEDFVFVCLFVLEIARLPLLENLDFGNLVNITALSV